MAGYNRKEKSYSLTAERMEYYHRHHNHTSYPRKLCPICSAQYGQEYMEIAAAFFRKNGFDVLEVGDAHLTISAPSKARKKYGMWITKETDELYQLLAGRIDPQPGSLPASPDDLDPHENHPSETSDFPSTETPLEAFQAWLQDLKCQQLEAPKADSSSPGKNPIHHTEINLIDIIQAKLDKFSN